MTPHALPIVPRYDARPAPYRIVRAEQLAEQLLREQPELAPDSFFRPLVPTELADAPALHLDDLAGIPLLDRSYDMAFLEDRARLRAVGGDLVASCAREDPAYERYCEERLGLGAVTWLRPQPRRNRLSVASACWEDRGVRATLVAALRAGRLRYLHPHMGSSAVWITAALLRRASRRPLSVIAPHPGLTRAVNDKLWFADVAERMFGRRAVPKTARAENVSTLSRLVSAMASEARTLVLKVPDSAGGKGIVQLDAAPFRGCSLRAVRRRLKEPLDYLEWPGDRPLLVGKWERRVLSSPSIQLWIPPGDEPPVVEGLFEQMIEHCSWAGSRRAQLPEHLQDEIVVHSWLLARLYQCLGYAGRCSFDLVLVGDELETCRVEFLECNGRWGGTSVPMTLMNRIFAGRDERPYAFRSCRVSGLRNLRFPDLLEHFAADLFDARAGTGRLLFLSPAGLPSRSSSDVVALGSTWGEAERTAVEEVPARLAEIAGRPSTRSA